MRTTPFLERTGFLWSATKEGPYGTTCVQTTQNPRRKILLILFLASGFCAGQTTTQPARPTVGAIRWDGWFGPTGTVGKAVHATLAPAKWHYRLPFYAKVLGDNRIEIDGTPQATMDREIEYAANAGLGYWAFVTYSGDDPLSLALKRYLSSPVRSKINFCLITECARWPATSFADRLLSLMQEPGYQRTPDGRPLLYLGFIEDKWLKKLGGIEGFRKTLDAFRSEAAAKGLPKPYIVIMDFHADQGKKWADALGCDAISTYAAGWNYGRVPYVKWAAATEQFWEQCRVTGRSVVPTVMTGWDPRPRVDTPTPWGSAYSSHNGQVDRADTATPAQIADHLNDALRWLITHRDAAPAQTAIIYAWNEFDEGGWLAPTLSEGTARLDAIHGVLQHHTPSSFPAASQPPP